MGVSFRFLLTPKWIAWTVVVVVAVVVMAYLSMWQLGRLSDRRATNAAIEQRATEPVVGVDDPSLQGLDIDDLRYRRLTATGTYLPDGEVLVANQTLGGAPGWWVVTPLRTTSGTVVLVNRGWVPFSTVTPDGSFEAFAPPADEVSVSGLVQSGQTRVVGLADDARALPRLDVDLLADRLAGQGSSDVARYWLQLEDQQPRNRGPNPLPSCCRPSMTARTSTTPASGPSSPASPPSCFWCWWCAPPSAAAMGLGRHGELARHGPPTWG